MISIPKVVGVLSCGFLLGLGLYLNDSHTIKGEVMRVEPSAYFVQQFDGHFDGDQVRVEYGDYVVKGQDGKEVRLTTDKKTQMMGQLKKGDRVEAKVTPQRLALVIRQVE